MTILNVRAEALSKEGKVRPAPEMLSGAGPVIPVTISLSDESLRAYSKQEKKLPQGINGFALIDTGASTTCFDEDAAIKAGLPIVDTMPIRLAQADILRYDPVHDRLPSNFVGVSASLP